MFKRLFAISLTTLITLMPIAAQTPATPAAQPSSAAQDQETVRVGISVVQLDAVVTEKSGRRVTGLTAADFQITDEGAPQTVDFFSAIEGSRARKTDGTGTAAQSSAPSAPVSPLTIPYEGRHMALVFDDLNLTSENFLRSRRAFADYINTGLTPNDMVALISTGGALASMQQFTNDKQRLLSALNRIGALPRSTESGRRQYGMTDAEAIRIDSGDSGALENVKRRSAVVDAGPTGTIADESVGVSGRPTGGGDAATDANNKGIDDARIRNLARTIVGEIGANARNNLATLARLFRGMADLPGRKIVILMTESFIVAGGTSADTTNELSQVIEIARRGGISVYALDAAGLRTENVTASEHITGTGLAFRNVNPDLTMGSSEKMGGARALVSGTGGEFIGNTNNLIGGLKKAIDDSSTYYVVGFKPSALDNKFHRLSITIKGKPDLIVRTRRGYLAVNEDTLRGTDAELVRALKSPVPLMDLPVDLVANVVPSSGEQVVVIGMHIGRNYLSLPAANAANQTVTYEILSFAFMAGRDAAAESRNGTLAFDFVKNPQARQRLKTEGLVHVPEPIKGLAPGVYQFRAVIRESTSGAVGSAYQFFEVPDLKDRKNVSMSGIVLTSAGQTEFSGANSFKPGSEVDMRFIIYNSPKENSGIVQRVQLVNAKGDVLLDSPLAILASVGADKSLAQQATRLPLPPMRGRYSVIVSLKDSKGKIDVERRTELVVE